MTFDPANPVGIHADISDDLYGEAAGVRRSELKCLSGGHPADVLHYQKHGIEDSSALLLGRAVDCAVLTPEDWDGRFVIYEGAARRGKAWEAFALEHKDSEILTVAEMQIVSQCLEVVHKSPVASGLLSGTKRQLSAWWEHTTLKGNTLLCKTRPDAVIEEHGRTIDVKTTADFSDDAFARDVRKYGYDLQAFMNCEGFLANAFDWREHVLIVIRKPTGRVRCDVRCFVWTLDSPWLRRGEHVFQALAHRYESMVREQQTYGWADLVTELPMPKWVAGEMAELEQTNSQISSSND